MNSAQQSNAITNIRNTVGAMSTLIPGGVAQINRLVALGVLAVDGSGVFSPGPAIIAPTPATTDEFGNVTQAADGGAFAGENDHLNAQTLADAANVLMPIAAALGVPATFAKLAVVIR